MPILPPETDIYPYDLLDAPCANGDDASHWWALYTRSRREKDVMRRLLGMEIPFYAPMIKRKSRSSKGRLRESYVPLFSGYVFLFGTVFDREQALKTNCVSRVLPVTSPEDLARDLKQIQLLVETDAPLSPEARLEAGSMVRVRSGPMLGIEGVVVQRRGQDRLLVAVEFLQQGASVLLEDFLVEPI